MFKSHSDQDTPFPSQYNALLEAAGRSHFSVQEVKVLTQVQRVRFNFELVSGHCHSGLLRHRDKWLEKAGGLQTAGGLQPAGRLGI